MQQTISAIALIIIFLNIGSGQNMIYPFLSNEIHQPPANNVIPDRILAEFEKDDRRLVIRKIN